MATVAANVPTIESYIPGGKKKPKNKGKNIRHQQYFKDVFGKQFYNFFFFFCQNIGTWLYLAVRIPGRCSLYLEIHWSS